MQPGIHSFCGGSDADDIQHDALSDHDHARHCGGVCHGHAGSGPGCVKKGQEVYTAQKCQLCHAIAGKGSKTNPLDGVGAKLSADDIKQWITHPVEAAAKAKSTKKPPMPAKYGSLPAADSTRSSPTCRA